jgi:hypothetical protein
LGPATVDTLREAWVGEGLVEEKGEEDGLVELVEGVMAAT